MRGAETLRAAAAAVAFLTRIPVGRAVVLDAGDVARGGAAFPLVGAAVGAAVGGTAEGLVHILPALAAAGVALALGALITGALHLDALADMADALTAGRERALAIMRDHAIGAYGASALVLDLLVKAAALAALAAHRHAVPFAIAAGALGRAAPVALGAALPGVRGDGAGASFAGRVSRAVALIATASAAAICLAAGGLHGLELVGIAIAATLGLGLFTLRWLGGVTGDTLGATAELVETITLVSAAALTASR
jgi:cobalamin 5'-phosphate synthase/cobalamin synthase